MNTIPSNDFVKEVLHVYDLHWKVLVTNACIDVNCSGFGGDPGVQNQKTPTIVLLTPEEEFHSLGFIARDTYHDLDPKEAKKWLYFDKFKMALHADQ
ncbi:Heat shock 70 kDa protein 12A [Halocaridina rubra]|uniref:Heat shock 70 kDa protein 12A n=1 Tax=Halocaridina rubra TaxID=373956 RepID=A0AAN8XK23_HALRR